METPTLRDEVRDHDRDWHPVHDKETFANIDTFLQIMYPVRDPLHGIETLIKINTLRRKDNVRSHDPHHYPIHAIERVIKIDTSHNVRSHNPDRDPVHSIE